MTKNRMFCPKINFFKNFAGLKFDTPKFSALARRKCPYPVIPGVLPPFSRKRGEKASASLCCAEERGASPGENRGRQGARGRLTILLTPLFPPLFPAFSQKNGKNRRGCFGRLSVAGTGKHALRFRKHNSILRIAASRRHHEFDGFGLSESRIFLYSVLESDGAAPPPQSKASRAARERRKEIMHGTV